MYSIVKMVFWINVIHKTVSKNIVFVFHKIDKLNAPIKSTNLKISIANQQTSWTNLHIFRICIPNIKSTAMIDNSE